MEGRILADYPVYYSANPNNLEELRWKLGGIDCIFFTRSGGEEISHEASKTPVDRKSTFSKTDLFVKRSFDLGVSFVLLVVFSPLIALCSLLIKLDDGGPVFYRQERMGKGGRLFHLVKFRSMRTDAESMGVPALCSGEDDPRLTRIGRFLRAHHLDELPQLWNVFVGDMSFVGYRPERLYFVNQIMQRDNRFQYLFQLAPGVTSYSTLYNGYTDTIEKMITRLDHDIYYLRSRSIWFDAKILALTFLSIVSGKKF
ncbi:MAG: sugar transferase [Bacteroidales bacterium]|nr:sugar transferase [Bacteroidales bacterium]MBQ9195116.1 sugar transferase [Bacteroidales bacterium]